jgi:hypothetical protein
VLAAAVVALDGNPSAYLLVSTEPWASITAREAKFSEAISSRWVCWRSSSLPIRAAMAGSPAARDWLIAALSAIGAPERGFEES